MMGAAEYRPVRQRSFGADNQNYDIMGTVMPSGPRSQRFENYAQMSISRPGALDGVPGLKQGQKGGGPPCRHDGSDLKPEARSTALAPAKPGDQVVLAGHSLHGPELRRSGQTEGQQQAIISSVWPGCFEEQPLDPAPGRQLAAA
jgi:hypothetical protein